MHSQFSSQQRQCVPLSVPTVRLHASLHSTLPEDERAIVRTTKVSTFIYAMLWYLTCSKEGRPVLSPQRQLFWGRKPLRKQSLKRLECHATPCMQQRTSSPSLPFPSLPSQQNNPGFQILPPSTISRPISSSSPLSAVRRRSRTHRPSPASSCSRTYVTLSAALPFRECPPRQPPPLGVIGEEAEMGDTNPTDWRRGPLDEVAVGEDRDVSMGGGDAGC